MNRKLIFFDIDGTLMDRDMNIEHSTREAFEKLHDQGHYTFLCSGRSRGYIFNPKLLSLGFDGIVAGCGTDVEAFQKKLVYHSIPKEKLSTYYALCHENRIGSLWEGSEKIFADHEILKENGYYQFLRKQLGPRMLEISGNEADWDVNKITVTFDEASNDEAIDQLEEDFHILRHAFHVAELVPKGFSKASGIKAVVDEMQANIEDVYAIGDSINDLEMLSFAGHAIAMGNGVDQVKEIAEYVTSDIHQDGVYEAMLHYGLITK